MDRPGDSGSGKPLPDKCLRITQVKGTAGRPRKQRRVLAGLGLSRPGNSVVREDTPSIRGMVAKVSHLVQVESVDVPEEGQS